MHFAFNSNNNTLIYFTRIVKVLDTLSKVFFISIMYVKPLAYSVQVGRDTIGNGSDPELAA